MAFSVETAPYFLKVVENFLPEETIFLGWQDPDPRQEALMQLHDLARRAFARGWQIWIDDLEGATSIHGARIYTKIFDLKSLFDVLERKGVKRETVYALIESEGLDLD